MHNAGMSETQPPVLEATPDPIQAGRDALARHDWAQAFEQLSQADAGGRLAAADLESLALAAFFTAQPDLVVSVKERAFKAHEAEGDQIRAAYLALDIARNYGYAGKHSIASAWTRRAEKIIGPGDGETYAHGYLALVRSEAAGG